MTTLAAAPLRAELRWRGVSLLEPSYSSLRRALCRGVVSLRLAEDTCDRLRIHPVEVWGQDYYAAVEVWLSRSSPTE